MILVYVDDVLHLLHDTQATMSQINSIYHMKEDPCIPDRYLGANIDRLVVGDKVLFTMTCRDYVNAAVDNLEKTLTAK